MSQGMSQASEFDEIFNDTSIANLQLSVLVEGF